MIIRILGEGQFDMDDVEHLNVLDDWLQAAADADDDLVVSDLVLPHDGASLSDVRAMLGDDGLIPGRST